MEPQLFNFKGQPTLSSRQVAKMIGKQHKHLMRDIRRYISDISTSPNLDPLKFFVESTYEDAKGEMRDCYLLTKKGCEFVANKMTGKKGNQFTARYVDLFNEYQEEHFAIESHMTSDELAFKKQELEFKKQWLHGMEEQNANKRAELLIKIASFSREPAEYLQEASNQLMFPITQSKSFSSSEIARQLGTTPYNVGVWGQRLGLKAPRGMNGRYGYWNGNRYFYNEAGFNDIINHRDEILAGEEF